MGKKSSKTRRQGKDGLSPLPDEIIIDILSLLPLKFAVKSAVLSQRWRYLWTQITAVNISFSIRELCDITEFREILNQVLLKLTSPTIRKFQVIATPTYFHISSEIQRLFNDQWFSEICARNVEEIELKQFGSAIPRLPRCLFKSRSLVSLELCKARFLSNLPKKRDSINLPLLKKLIVQDIYTSECGLSEKLIKSCPSLEVLSLFFTTLPQHPFTICGMNLKRLLIELSCCCSYGKFVIDTSKLQYLTVNSYFGFSLDSNNMALVDGHMKRFTCTGDGWCLTSAHYVMMSTMVRSFEIEVGSRLSALIKLPYLTRLELSNDKNFCTKRLLQALHCCLVLEILVCSFLYATNKGEGDDLSGESPDLIVPKCLLTRVKKIKIKTRLTHCRNLKLIEFLLCKGLVLELLLFRRRINPRCLNDNKREELNVCKKMYGCQRSSSRCKIEFSGLYVNVTKEGGTVMGHDGEMVFLK